MSVDVFEAKAVVVKEEPKVGTFGNYTRTSVKISPPHPKGGEWLSFNKAAAEWDVVQGQTYKWLMEFKPKPDGQSFWMNAKEAPEHLAGISSPAPAAPSRPAAPVLLPSRESVGAEPFDPIPTPTAESWLDKDSQIARQVVVKCLAELSKSSGAMDTLSKAAGVDMALTSRDRLSALCTAMETYIKTGVWA